MNWNSFAIMRGGFHTRTYATREVVYVSRRVLLFAGGTGMCLDEPVANERAGMTPEEVGGLAPTWSERAT